MWTTVLSLLRPSPLPGRTQGYGGPVSSIPQAVADRPGLTKGTMSRQIEKAVAGLMTVEVSPHSRRQNIVALTSEGTKLVRQGDEIFQRSREALLAGIGDDDFTVTIRTLSALSDRLDSYPSALGHLMPLGGPTSPTKDP